MLYYINKNTEQNKNYIKNKIKNTRIKLFYITFSRFLHTEKGKELELLTNKRKKMHT